MAVDAFIAFDRGANTRIVPIVGETQDEWASQAKPPAFEIHNFSFGIRNASSMGSSTSGAGSSKAEFDTFTIQKWTDISSPAFFKNCVVGAHYETVTVAIRKQGSGAVDAQSGSYTNTLPYLVYRFKTVFTTKVEWSGPGAEFGPEESIEFVFGEMQIEYHRQKADGSLETAVIGQWSQLTNTTEFGTGAGQ